ncbi:hypothetical protein, partial [Treponema endosymbiont of Eucomonympha sp.]|uniref:hypothetical protein n=1 Tax=Treponema endosymbiont of Eucomonympha sp. TaxID=1580831 RepID=UPI0035A04450
MLFETGAGQMIPGFDKMVQDMKHAFPEAVAGKPLLPVSPPRLERGVLDSQPVAVRARYAGHVEPAAAVELYADDGRLHPTVRERLRRAADGKVRRAAAVHRYRIAALKTGRQVHVGDDALRGEVRGKVSDRPLKGAAEQRDVLQRLPVPVDYVPDVLKHALPHRKAVEPLLKVRAFKVYSLPRDIFAVEPRFARPKQRLRVGGIQLVLLKVFGVLPVYLLVV